MKHIPHDKRIEYRKFLSLKGKDLDLYKQVLQNQEELKLSTIHTF